MGIEDLLAGPLKEFTAARNALVAELRRAGKSAEAAAAQKLRKPTLPIWVVNQVARRHGAEVKALVATADDLKRASLGRGGNLQEAAAKHQAGVRALLRRAEQVLKGAGYRPSPDVMLRVSNTFLGAAADPAARSGLSRGRLTEELRPPGLESLLEASERTLGKVISLETARGHRARAADDGEASRATGATVAGRSAAGATGADRGVPGATAGDRSSARATAASAARTAAADRDATRAATVAARARKRAETQARARLRTAEQTEARLRKRAEQAERAVAALRARLQVAERDAAEARAAQQRAAEVARRAHDSLRD